MFERRQQPLLPMRAFYWRVGRYAALAVLLVAVSWIIGILGYRIFEGMAWIDAILNAAMILGGMGPVNELHTVAGKLFASFYALFAGVIFLVDVGILIAPIFHRFLHQFNLEADVRDDTQADSNDVQSGETD